MRGRGNLQIFQQFSKQLAVFRQVNVAWIGPNNRQTEMLQRHGQVQRRLPTELHNQSVRLLDDVDIQNLFLRQRLKIQPVAGVVIRRDCLRIAVHHDGFIAEVLQRERGVATAVVELNSLPNTVRPAAQNHHLLAIAWGGLVFRLIA